MLCYRGNDRDVFCLHGESLEDSDNLPPLNQASEEIMGDLPAALEYLEQIPRDLG